jgi:hypothetical protein
MYFYKISVITNYIFGSKYAGTKFSDHSNIHYVNFMILICDVFLMIRTLCPGRCCALLDITECCTASCTYVDFTYWITLLHYTVD